MKNLLLYFFCSISFCSIAQVHSAMPPEATTFYINAMCCIKPEIKYLIVKKAAVLKSNNTDSLLKALKRTNLLSNLSTPELEAVIVLIMVQASKNADTNLKELVINMVKTGQNSEGSSKTKIILDYKSNMAESIKSLMKKIAPSRESVIDNLK